MDEKRKYTIIGLAPREIKETFDKIRLAVGLPAPRHELPSGRVILKDEPHFAVKRSFFLPEGFSEQDLLDLLKDFRFQPFPVVARTSGIFASTPYGAVLHAVIERDRLLVHLHIKLKKRLDEHVETKNPEYEGAGYIPHLTVIYNVPPEKADQARRVLDAHLPIQFTLDAIYLLRNADAAKDEYETIATYHAL